MPEETTNEQKDRARKVFMQYYPYIAKVAFRIAPRVHLQGDIINDTFIEFVKNANRWDFEKNIKALLSQITIRIGLKYWTEYKRSQPESLRILLERIEQGITQVDNSFGTSLTDQRIIALESCRKKLTFRNQRLIELYYDEDRSYREIAKIVQQNELSLPKTMYRIRLWLAECIEKFLNMRMDNEL